MRKPFKLDMTFAEALARIAQTPKGAPAAEEKRQQKPKAGANPPRTGRRKTA
jgi:hypothetical protein